MLRTVLVTALLMLATEAGAQTTDYRVAPEPRSGGAQHGAQPNPLEVQPGNPDGDAPSAAVGTVQRDAAERRMLGLPITAIMVIGAVLIGLLLLAGLTLPRARRGRRARGGGTYGSSPKS